MVDRHLRIEYYNHAAKELLGLPEDISRLRLSQLMSNVDWRRILQLDAEEWTRVSRQEVEILYPQPRILQFYLAPFEEGKFAAVILQDITESRRRALETMREETTQAVSLLAAGVAHEIGNPLNSLYLNLQLLGRELKTAPEETREMVGACTAEVERLDHLINRFLQALRPGNPHFAPLDLRQLLLDTLEFMRQEFLTSNVQAECDFPDALPLISGDAEQLKQAFFNLLKNGLQATASGGIIKLIAGKDENWVWVEVADSGKGIAPEEMSRIFEPFKSFREGGRGIGMMIVERVFREHGAELQLDSQVGCGTRITVKFPREGRRRRLLQLDSGENTVETSAGDSATENTL